ncbi:protein FAR1-RELATED SEQUENCE 5-like [Salvia miltiorrhiza]|uniref:protein FAR1-RELATED SEQUENCE 5-like n=1 Tax=Salvia miltiorrhiza TaxID=226208 RepID=UPI0025ACD65D|nr:protein FAR1-RELATED SEQUENCE 5-like [Salvia miltiorrhiza]
MVSAASRPFMKNKRKVSKIHEMFLICGIKASVGPMRTFRIYKEIVGTYDKVGCTSLDFKNWRRDLRVSVNGSDAHMVLDTFKNKKDACDGFQYFYDIDGENQLKRLIWTDKSSVMNYKMFGEAVSFDATYNTNRYKMIFTPFTGRDNHGKSVSFGAALISHEDMESYSWVLEKFVECMGNAPRLIITDQDPGLKKAVAASWPNTRHHFCMWHITMKVAEKLPSNLTKDSGFKTEFGKIVWCDFEEPDTFEEKWTTLMDEYDLGGNKWFSDMFEDRTFWIPAYFKDCYTYRKLNHEDESEVPMMRTKLDIEEHASKIYTNTMFKDVQEEIEWSILGCGMTNMYSDEEDNVHIIRDNLNGEFTVRYVKHEDYLSCSCKLFIRKGILCRHIFFVIRNNDMKKIPEKYICSRWCKSSRLSLCGTELEEHNGGHPNPMSHSFHFFKVASDCIAHVKGNDQLSDQCLLDLEAVSQKYAKLSNTHSLTNNKESVFEDLYGCAPPEKRSVAAFCRETAFEVVVTDAIPARLQRLVAFKTGVGVVRS